MAPPLPPPIFSPYTTIVSGGGRGNADVEDSGTKGRESEASVVRLPKVGAALTGGPIWKPWRWHLFSTDHLERRPYVMASSCMIGTMTGRE